MKKLILLTLALIGPVAFAQTRVSVTRFDQQVDRLIGGCRGWYYETQDQLRTVLESELGQRGLKVLHRRDIRTVYADEFQLENLDQKTVAQRGKFLAAQYTISGGITELGVCESTSDSGVNLGGIVGLVGGPSGVDLEVGKSAGESKIKLTAQLISTQTGEIVKSFSAVATSSEGSSAVSGGYAGIGGRHKTSSRPPIERATNQALGDIAEQVAKFLKDKR